MNEVEIMFLVQKFILAAINGEENTVEEIAQEIGLDLDNGEVGTFIGYLVGIINGLTYDLNLEEILDGLVFHELENAQ